MADPINASDRLTVSPNGHYFLKNDAPFFWLGDTLWPVYNLYTLEEADFYFERRSQQGFTVIHTMLPFDGGPELTVSASNEAGQSPWVDQDPARPNELYFRKVDQVVALARQKGLYLAVMPLGGWSGSYIKQKQIITAENARVYGLWLGRRYKDAPNLIWANGADLLPWEYEQITRELAAGLVEGDGGAHLMTFHPGGKAGISSSYFQQENWLAANIIQTWSDYWNIHPLVYADYHRQPAKPVVMAEGAYEAGEEYPTRPITPHIIRMQAYWSYLAGGFHSYGHNDMWRKKTTWREALNAPGAGQMTVLKQLFTSRSWWKLIPDQSLFIAGSGERKTLNAAARSADGDQIIAYLSNRAEVTLDLSKITSGPMVHAEWMDPRSGERAAIGDFPNSGQPTFLPPETYEDAVLFLEGKSIYSA